MCFPLFQPVWMGLSSASTEIDSCIPQTPFRGMQELVEKLVGGKRLLSMSQQTL